MEVDAGGRRRHPDGPSSSLAGKDDHPVVQVSWDDAAAYARWAGKRLPTEAEWERAARGGLEGKPYVWGDEKFNPARPQANLWQGDFHYRNTALDGYERTAPVKSYAPNGYGLYDMAGNVWEWCGDWYQRDLYRQRAGAGVVTNPTGPAHSADPTQPFAPLRVQKGGSFLCSVSYCSRYRPSARHGCSPDTGMSSVSSHASSGRSSRPATVSFTALSARLVCPGYHRGGADSKRNHGRGGSRSAPVSRVKRSREGITK